MPVDEKKRWTNLGNRKLFCSVNACTSAVQPEEFNQKLKTRQCNDAATDIYEIICKTHKNTQELHSAAPTCDITLLPPVLLGSSSYFLSNHRGDFMGATEQ